MTIVLTMPTDPQNLAFNPHPYPLDTDVHQRETTSERVRLFRSAKACIRAGTGLWMGQFTPHRPWAYPKASIRSLRCLSAMMLAAAVPLYPTRGPPALEARRPFYIPKILCALPKCFPPGGHIGPGRMRRAPSAGRFLRE